MNYFNKTELTAVLGEEKEGEYEEAFRTFNIPNTELSTGERGVLQVGIVPTRNELPKQFDVGVEEEKMRLRGVPFEKVVITSDFLDNWEYFIEVETESMYQQKKSLDIALANEKLEIVMRAFPEIFMANKEEFFKEFIRQYNDTPDKYLERLSQAQPAMPQEMGGSPNQTKMAQMLSGLATPEKPVQNVPMLSGM